MTRRNSNSSKGISASTQVGCVPTGCQIVGLDPSVLRVKVLLIFYLRSANAWSRFLLANVIFPNEPITFSYVEPRIPEMYFNPDRFLRQFPLLRKLKSHDSFQSHYPRVKYIVRDRRRLSPSGWGGL